MAFWYFYFFSKFFLHFRDYIHASFYLNALLLAAILIPLPSKWRESRPAGLSKNLSLAAASVALLWHESWLPPVGTIIQFLTDSAGRPSLAYLVEFLRRGVNPALVIVMALVAAASVFVAKWKIRLTPLILVLLGALAISDPASLSLRAGADLLAGFYRTEAGRYVEFKNLAPDDSFDIIIVEPCSLSWDDMIASGSDPAAFFSKFDYVFTDFSSGATYSNPAMLRLLRGACGQPRHADLFKDARKECYLMDSLRSMGYKTFTVLNHDGKYSHFEEESVRFAHMDPPMPLAGISATRLNFDNTPIYDDLEVLKKWWQTRPEAKSAVYYNTISLHMGAHSQADGWKGTREERYKKYLALFLKEMDEFLDILEKSNRKVVVVFVPEHGAAYRGTRMQAPDVRDIPLPQIAAVPAAVKIFGPGHNGRRAAPSIISKPSSYLAIAYMLEYLIEHPPYGKSLAVPESLIARLPQTQFVAETESGRVARIGDTYMYEPAGGSWIKIPQDSLPSTSQTAASLDFSGK